MIAPVDPALQGALRLALASLLSLAAVHKLRDREGFRGALRGYALLPERAIRPVGLALPGLEGAAAAALLLPPAARGGAALALALLGLYTAAISINLARGRRDIDCGCGGPAARRGLGADLLCRNALLLVVAAVCGAETAPRPLVWVDAITIGGAAASLVLVYLAAEAAPLRQGAGRVPGRALRNGGGA